jgi:hypothetical protein
MDLRDRHNIDDRRTISDRRKQPTPFVSRYTFVGGRRKTFRRKEDRKKHNYIDLYSSSLLITILVFLVLILLAVFIFFNRFSITGIFKGVQRAL